MAHALFDLAFVAAGLAGGFALGATAWLARHRIREALRGKG